MDDPPLQDEILVTARVSSNFDALNLCSSLDQSSSLCDAVSGNRDLYVRHFSSFPGGFGSQLSALHACDWRGFSLRSFLSSLRFPCWQVERPLYQPCRRDELWPCFVSFHDGILQIHHWQCGVGSLDSRCSPFLYNEHCYLSVV